MSRDQPRLLCALSAMATAHTNTDTQSRNVLVLADTEHTAPVLLWLSSERVRERLHGRWAAKAATTMAGLVLTLFTAQRDHK